MIMTVTTYAIEVLQKNEYVSHTCAIFKVTVFRHLLHSDGSTHCDLKKKTRIF